MPIIKSINAPKNLAPFSMRDIEAHARAIISRAQQQADQLLAGAQSMAEEMKKQAVAEGVVEGRKQGLAGGSAEGKKAGQQQALQEHKQELTDLIAALTVAAKDLNASRKQLEATASGEVVKLAVSIARRVTRKFGELDPTVLTANVAEAMTLVVHSTDVRIALHPSQRDVLSAALPQLKMQWPSLEHVSLLDDESIQPGGCRIYAGQGEVNGDLETQIDRIAMELLPFTDPNAANDNSAGGTA